MRSILLMLALFSIQAGAYNKDLISEIGYRNFDRTKGVSTANTLCDIDIGVSRESGYVVSIREWTSLRYPMSGWIRTDWISLADAKFISPNRLVLNDSALVFDPKTMLITEFKMPTITCLVLKNQ